MIKVFRCSKGQLLQIKTSECVGEFKNITTAHEEIMEKPGYFRDEHDRIYYYCTDKKKCVRKYANDDDWGRNPYRF